MKTSRCHWALLAAGLVLACLVAPRAARASCGDHATILPFRPEAVPVDPASEPMPGQASVPTSPAPSPPAPLPCQGPRCSQGRTPLPPPPSTAPTIEDDRWGQGALTDLLVDADSALLPLTPTPIRPMRGGCSIYHPPR